MQDKSRINEKRWRYLAGYMDGDGSFYIGSHPHKAGYINYDVSLSISTTFRPTSVWLKETFGGQVTPTQDKRANRKPGYLWYVSNSKHQLDILSMVIPHLKLKKRQAELIAEFLNLGGREFQDPDVRRKMCEEVETLNIFFVPVERVQNTSKECTADKADFQYLAGLIDAEGCVSLYKGRRCFDPRIQIANTDMRVFEFLTDRFGSGVSKYQRQNRALGNWCLPTRYLENVLLAIIPYMTTKRKQAMLLLNWVRAKQNLSKSESMVYVDQFRELNFRGISPTTNTVNCPENGQKIESDLIGDYECEPMVTLAS